jgi:foldase protein PrsA
MPSIRGTISAACALCVALAIGIGIAACGDPGAAGDMTVARVGSHAITKATLEHWTDVEAVLAYETEPKHPVPSGVVPDPPAYSRCVAYLEKTTSPEPGQAVPTRSQLKRRCQERRRSLQRHVLDILLLHYWLLDEGAEQGVKVTSAEVKKTLDRTFPNEAAYRRYLALTGETPADERLIIEKDRLDTRLLQTAEAKRAPQPKSLREHEQAMIEAATAFTKKWKARTSCSAGYVVTECKQYKGPLSLVAP